MNQCRDPAALLQALILSNLKASELVGEEVHRARHAAAAHVALSHAAPLCTLTLTRESLHALCGALHSLRCEP